MNNIYNTYYFIRLLKDKGYESLKDYYKGVDKSVMRYYDQDKHFYSDIVNLTLKPTFIIDNIYLGNSFNASHYYKLKKYKIKHIINITNEIKNYYEDNKDFNYIRIPIFDREKDSVSQFLKKCVEMFEYLRKQNGNILIHCYMGSSRSVIITMLYLIVYHKMETMQGLEFIKEKRDIVNPNMKFLIELFNFRKNLKLKQ